MKQLLTLISTFATGYILIWGGRQIQVVLGSLEIGVGVSMLLIILLAGLVELNRPNP